MQNLQNSILILVVQLSFLSTILLGEIKKRKFLPKALFIAFSYLFLAIFLFNYPTFHTFIFNDYPIFAKIRILTILFFGSFQILSIRDSILLIIVSLLFGINIELVLRKLKFLKSKGSLHIAFGAGIVSFVAVGCAACGLSFGSIIGLAWILAMLPFHGLELYVLSIVILLVSLFYNINAYVKACNLS